MGGNKGEGAVFATVQKIGRSFFLPVSILPVAGLLLGLGASFTNGTTIEAYNLEGLLGSGTVLNALLTIMSQVGSTIFDNLPIIFAMAVALGMAKNEKAVAVLASAVSFFVMHTTINAMLRLSGQVLADGSYAESVLDGAFISVCGIESLQMGVFGGIIVGMGVAALHNRFYKQQLPAALSFFSGVRFVPIISVVAYMFIGIGCYFLWPHIQNAIFAAGGLVTNSGYAGTFIFGLLERALIPFGLHHVFYIPFWQTGLGGTAIIDGVTFAGAQNIYFAELASSSVSRFSVDACRFMTGKYTVMMAGLPGAAYAMYKCAKPENRKVVGGLFMSAALTSFLTGITEPIEFTFLFIAPALFAVHCVFAGLGFLICHLLEICIGTTFSCGLIDFILYGVLQGNAKTNWLLIIPVYIAYAAGYYFLFKTVITKFNLATPGREEGEGEIKLYSRDDYNKKSSGAAAGSNSQKSDEMSAVILKGVGGMKNLVDIDCCATRLRLTVDDSGAVNDNILKSTGARGVVKKGSGIQVIYGPQVSIIKSDFEEYVERIRMGEVAAADEGKEIYAPADGWVIPMSDVPDEAFAQCVMGNGIAVKPSNGTVVAPCDGEVSIVMEDTSHAVGIHAADGFDVLIHIGVDTVSLKGEGFQNFVTAGQKVKAGEKLIEFDREFVESKGLCPDVIMIFIDDENLPAFEYKTEQEAKAARTVVALMN